MDRTVARRYARPMRGYVVPFLAGFLMAAIACAVACGLVALALVLLAALFP